MRSGKGSRESLTGPSGRCTPSRGPGRYRSWQISADLGGGCADLLDVLHSLRRLEHNADEDVLRASGGNRSKSGRIR